MVLKKKPDKLMEMGYVNPVFWKEKTITLLLLNIAVFFAFHQSGLGFLDYIPEGVLRVFQIIMIASSILLAFWVFLNSKSLPPIFKKASLALLSLNILYGFLGILYKGGVGLIFHIESITFIYIAILIISDSKIFSYFNKIVFYFGVLLVFLNMVPILYYLGIVDIGFETIPRLIVTEEYHPDSISFGIFGRAESSEAPDKFFARLHGWSLEPIHWGYYVIHFIASGIILYSRAKTANSKILILFFLIFLFVHIYFVQSVVVFFVLALWFLLLMIVSFVRRVSWLKKMETTVIFSFFLIYGLLIPFAMTFIPGIEALLLEDKITNKGTNWAAKIDFLSLGSSLFTRIIPSNTEVTSSHNFILSLYIKYGYFLILPFFFFLFWFIKNFISKQPFTVMSAGVLIILAHMVCSPPLFFHPSGILFIGLILATVSYSKTHKSSFY
jgi:hypothetical protein